MAVLLLIYRQHSSIERGQIIRPPQIYVMNFQICLIGQVFGYMNLGGNRLSDAILFR